MRRHEPATTGREWHDHIKPQGRCRSGFEAKIAEQLERSGVEYGHEVDRLEYHNHEGRKFYIPYFTVYLSDEPMFIEAKGWLNNAGRLKLQAVAYHNPDADIRLVFQSGTAKVGRLKSNVCQWADMHWFPHAVGEIPSEWLKDTAVRD